MERTIKGIDIKKLSGFTPVLNAWMELNSRLADEWWEPKQNGDVPWWYGERACLGLFVGAVWKTGGLAFEEYKSTKRGNSKASNGRHGRADLWLKIGDSAYSAEAKKAWPHTMPSKSLPHLCIEESLNVALKQLNGYRHNEAKRLGIVFAHLRVRRSHKNDVGEIVHEWTERIREVRCDCCAWFFPGKFRYTEGGKSICPGSAIFLKVAH